MEAATTYINFKTKAKRYFLTPKQWLEKWIIEHDTLPNEIIVTPKEFTFEDNISIFSLKKYLKNRFLDFEKKSELSNYYDEICEQLYRPASKTEFGLLWWELNEELVGNKMVKSFYQSILNTLTSEFYNLDSTLKNAKRKRDDTFKKLKHKTSMFEDVEKEMKVLKETTFSPFSLEGITVARTIIDAPADYLTFFDQLKATVRVPFIHVISDEYRYTKIFNHKPPSQDWLNSLEGITGNAICFYVQKNRNNIDLADTDKYQRSFAMVLCEIKEGQMWIEYKEEKETDEMEENIHEAITQDYELGEPEQTGIKGNFSAPDIFWNKEIVLDMAFNDTLWSFYFILNEVDAPGMKKKKFSLKFLSDDPYYSLSISMNNTDEGNLIIKVSKVKSAESLKFFVKIFMKLLTHYLKTAPIITDIYQRLWPSFQLNSIHDLKKVKITGVFSQDLRKSFPDAFLPGWTKNCGQKRQPSIISKDKISEIGEDNVLEWPYESGNYLTCHQQETHPYIGMQENRKLSNKNDYPYLPCCFAETKKDKAVKSIKDWKTMEMTKNRGKTFTDSNKPHTLNPNARRVDANRQASLPLKMAKYFKLLGFGSLIQRYGVPQSPNSFLYAVLRAVKPMEYARMNEKKMDEYRMSLIDEINLAVVKQEMFDYTMNDIKKYIKSTRNFFDPRLVYRLMEVKYDINIYLFVRDETRDADFLLPRSSHAHLHMKKDPSKPAVMIILQESLDSHYPYQCELLIDFQKAMSGVFSQKPFVENLLETWYVTHNVLSTVENKLVSYKTQNFDYVKQIISQYIDDQGKVRILRFSDDWGGVNVLTSPLPPTDLPYELNGNLNTKKQVDKFLKKSGAVVKERSEELVSIVYQGFNMKIFLEVDYSDVVAPVYESTLSDFRRQKKIAGLLEEIATYYYAVQKKLDMSSFLIDPYNNYRIKKLTRFSDIKDAGFLQANKIIVDNDDIAERLIQFVQLRDKKNHRLVMSYADKDYIPNQYRGLGNFKSYAHNIIFGDIFQLKKWIAEGGMDSGFIVVKTEIYPTRFNSYFFMNPLVLDLKQFTSQPVLIQNTNTLAAATQISRTWRKDGMNTVFSDSTEVLPHTLIDLEGNTKGKGKELVLEMTLHDGPKYAAVLLLD